MIKLILILLMFFSVSSAAIRAGGLDNALDISTSGVITQRMKMEVIAHNIANVDTVRTEQGTPYRKKEVVIRPVEDFSSTKLLTGGVLGGVRVSEIKESIGRYNKVYDPEHPDADSEGYVLYPNVNLTTELVEMTNANNAFEANVVVYNTTKAMMQSSLEIGR